MQFDEDEIYSKSTEDVMAKRNERILLAIDTKDTSTEGSKLIERVENCGQSLSKLLDLPVGYVAVTGLSELDTNHADKIIAERRRKAEARLARLNPSPELLLRFGTPAGEILSLISAKPRAGFVVMGTRGQTGLKHIWDGSVAEEVIRHSSCPVAVIGPCVETDGEIPKKPSILVATDFGAPARSAARYAAQLAQRWNSRVTLLFCLGDELRAVQEAVFNSGLVPYDFKMSEAELRAEAERDIAKLAAQLSRQSEVNIVTEIRRGLSADEIPQAAKSHDLLVIGTRGRHRLVSAFFGSTARSMLISSPRPVIVIPPKMKF